MGRAPSTQGRAPRSCFIRTQQRASSHCDVASGPVDFGQRRSRATDPAGCARFPWTSLMGGCLSQLVQLRWIPGPGPVLAQAGPGCCGPARCLRPRPPLRVQLIHRVLPSGISAPRRSAPTQRGALHTRFRITPKRHYPLHQPQYPLWSLPRVCWDEGDKKVTLRRRSRWSTVRIPALRIPALRLRVLSSLARACPGCFALEEEPANLDGSHAQRRCEDCSDLVAPVPKAESQERGLPAESSGDPGHTRPAGILRSGSRNPITSSYSSLQGFHLPHVHGWKNPGRAWLQIPARPASRDTEQQPGVPASASRPARVPHKVTPGARAPDPDAQRQQTPGTLLSAPGGSATRKRKIQLLRPRKGVPLRLPPAPQLGYRVTAEDVEAEKRARLRRVNEIFLEKTEAMSSTVMEMPLSFWQPAAPARAAPAPGPASAFSPAFVSHAGLCPAPASTPAYGFGANPVASTITSSSQAPLFGAPQASVPGDQRPSASATCHSLGFPRVTGMASSPSNASGAPSFGAGHSGGLSASTPFGIGGQQSQLSNVLTDNNGFLGVQPCASGAPSFAIGVGSKTQDARQILESRRKRKK